MTELEKKVYNAIFRRCESGEYSSSVIEVAEELKMSRATVKGAVGSLVKKGKIIAEREERAGKEFFDLFPRNDDGEILSFGEWC